MMIAKLCDRGKGNTKKRAKRPATCLRMHTYSAVGFFSTSSTFFFLLVGFSFSSFVFLFSALNCLCPAGSFPFCWSPSFSALPELSEAGFTVCVGFLKSLSGLRESLETDCVFWSWFPLTLASFVCFVPSSFFSGFAARVYTHTHQWLKQT